MHIKNKWSLVYAKLVCFLNYGNVSKFSGKSFYFTTIKIKGLHKYNMYKNLKKNRNQPIREAVGFVYTFNI